MNRPAGGNGGDVARGAGSAALKGGLLIGFAVIIGLILLQTVHDSPAASTSSPPPTTAKKPKTTTTKPKPKSTTTTTVKAAPPKTPAELKVIVLNAGAANGKADDMRTALLQVGYTSQAAANDYTGSNQTGNSVMCKPGLDREAVALSQQTPLQGSQVKPWPTPPPTTYGYAADCVVLVGAAG